MSLEELSKMLAKTPLPASSSEVSELYTMSGCWSCKESIEKLVNAGYEFDIITLDDNNMQSAFKLWTSRLGKNPNTVPQFWYKGKYIGGSAGIDKFLKENDVT